MLNKFSASAKLYVLILIATLSLTGLGLYGISVMDRMNESTQTLYIDRVLPFEQLSTIRFKYNTEIIPAVQKIKDRSLTFAEAADRVIRARKIIDANWVDYKRTYQTPEEQTLFRQAEEIKKQADEQCEHLLLILTAGDRAALEAFSSEFSSGQASFSEQLTQLMAIQVKVGKAIYQNANKTYRSASEKFIFLIAVSLFITIVLSYFIIKNIKGLIMGILRSNITIRESEEKYHSLFEQASDAIYTVNAKADFTDVNTSMCQLTGYTREELLTMNVADLLNEDLLTCNPLLYNTAKPGDAITGEKRFINKKGVVVEIEVNGKKFSNQRILVIVRDITERKLAEKELRLSEQKYRMIFDSSPLPMLMIDKADLAIIAANEEAVRLYGYNSDELLQMTVKHLKHRDDMDDLGDNFNENLAVSSDRGIYRQIKKDGTPISVQVIAHDIVFEGKKVRLAMYNDLTEKIKAEELHQKTEANLQTILNTTDTAYMLFGHNLELLEYNHEARLFAKNEFDFDLDSGGNFFDNIDESRRPQLFTYITDAFKGENISYEVFYDKPGRGTWYHVRMFPISNKENEILGIVMAITDITEQKEAGQHLQLAYERIKKQIKFIREMSWKQSHILRSPLANLKGLTNILLNDPGDKEVLGYVEVELERMDKVFIEMAQDTSMDDMNYN